MRINVRRAAGRYFVPNSREAATLASVLSLMGGAAAAWLLGQSVRDGIQQYTDVTVGSITWSGYYKSYDYILLYGFLLTFFTLWVASVPVCNAAYSGRLTRRPDQPGATGNIQTPHILLGLLAYGVGLWLMRGVYSRELIAISLVAAGWMLFRRKGWLADFSLLAISDANKCTISLLAIVFGYFSVIGLFALTKALHPSLPIDDAETAVAIGILVACVLAVLALVLLLHQERLAGRTWARILYGSQLLTPLLLVVLVHGLYEHNDTVVRNNIPFRTTVLVGATCLTAIGYNVRAFVRIPRCGRPPAVERLVLLPSVMSIVCFLAYRLPEYSGFARDDFHLGELIVPWQQVVSYRQEMYSGFVSVQGMMAVLLGAINSVLFDGTVSSFPLAYSFSRIVAVGITAGVVCRLAGNGWGLALGVSLASITDRLSLVLPILCVLCHPKVTAKPMRWLLAWGCLSVGHWFYNSIAGAALTIASLPVAVVMIWRAIGGDRLRHAWSAHRARMTMVIGAVLVMVWFVAPAGMGLLEFMLENGSMNTTAYGMGVFQFYGVPPWFPWQDKWAWEGVRIGGWLFGAVGLWHLFIRQVVNGEGPLACRLLAPASIVSLTGTLFLIALSPYSMGRIDPTGLGRPGSASMMTIGALLPLALVLDAECRKRVAVLVTAIGTLLGISSASSYESPAYLMHRALAAISVPRQARLVSGEDVGLPRIGTIFIEPRKLDELQRLRNVVNAILRPGETYYDLTNRSVMYFVLDKRVPGVYASVYSAANYEIQERVLAALKGDHPPLVWMEPSFRHDGGPASLRAYRIYRWLIQRGYRYYEAGGFKWLVREDRYRDLGLETLSAEDDASGLSTVFHQKALQAVPLSWGRNMQVLGWRFQKEDVALLPIVMNELTRDGAGWLRATGSHPYVAWTMPTYVDGKHLDFVTLQIDCAGNGDGAVKGQVFWADAENGFSEDRSFTFDVEKGDLLIPLGSHPRWLKSSRIRSLRLDIDDDRRCSPFRVGQVSFLNLVR